MDYPGGETREQSASSRSKRALVMLTGTYGPGDSVAWAVTQPRGIPGRREAFCQPPGSIPTASVTA